MVSVSQVVAVSVQANRETAKCTLNVESTFNVDWTVHAIAIPFFVISRI